MITHDSDFPDTNRKMKFVETLDQQATKFCGISKNLHWRSVLWNSVLWFDNNNNNNNNNNSIYIYIYIYNTVERHYLPWWVWGKPNAVLFGERSIYVIELLYNNM